MALAYDSDGATVQSHSFEYRRCPDQDAEAPAHHAIVVVGAGPVGLSLALHAARALPRASVTLFDARAAEFDISRDPRTLALSLGSVQLLERLEAWDAARAQPILEVHVSQQPPSWAPFGEPALRRAEQPIMQALVLTSTRSGRNA